MPELPDIQQMNKDCRHYSGLLPNAGCPTCGKGDMMLIGTVAEREIEHHVVSCKHCHQAVVFDEPVPAGELMLDIITPCSRPGNLPRMYQSIASVMKDIPIRWHIVLDTAHQQEEIRQFHYDSSKVAITLYKDNNPIVSPGRMRNHALRNILQDYRRWICFLDDDNVLHPNIAKILQSAFMRTSLWAFCVSCDAGGKILEALPDNMTTGKVDMAQLFVNSCLICGPGGMLFSEWGREEDGVLISKIFYTHQQRVGLVNEVASYHDGLTRNMDGGDGVDTNCDPGDNTGDSTSEGLETKTVDTQSK